MSLGASSQRVAYANLYANIGSDKLSEVRERKAKTVNDIESYANGLFDYYVPDNIYDFLVSKGVPLSINCFRTHSHPISKMIENHFLFNIIGNNLCKDSTFVSFKEDKLVFLRSKKSKISENVNVINRLIHAKDNLRYRDPLKEIWFGDDHTARKNLKNSNRVIIHDEVHYWSLKDFQKFLTLIDCPLIYSIIYPAELHAGHSFSLYPELYKFKLHGNGKTFTWAPDGCFSAAYVQPINKWLLSTNKTMDASGRTWTLSKLESVGAHHLFLCTPGEFVTEDEATYTDYTLVDPNIFGGLETKLPMLRASYMNKVIHYLLALKKPDAASAVSKLRQLSKGDETADELIFSGTLATQISDLKYFSEVGGLLDLKKFLTVGFSRLFGKEVQYFIARKWYYLDRFTETVKLMEPASITIQMGYAPMVGKVSKEFLEPNLGGLENRREKVGLEAVEMIADRGVPERKREPYSFVFSEGERMCDAGDPHLELAEFKKMLKTCLIYEEQKWFYSPNKPKDGGNYIFQEIARDIYLKVYLISNPAPHVLLCEGLIDLDTYRSMVGEAPVNRTLAPVEESSQKVEEAQRFEEGIEKIREVKKNLCLIKPIADHFAAPVEAVIAKATVEIPNFPRYLSEQGLSMPGLYMLCKSMDLTMSIISEGAYLHIQGAYKPIGFTISENHATKSPYLKFENDPAQAVMVNPGVGRMELEIDPEYAAALKGSFEKGFTGLKLNDQMGKWAPDKKGDGKKSIKVSTCFGFAGSGKTSCLTHMLKLGHGMAVVVVSPRRALSEEWKHELEGTDVGVFTYENFFIKQKHEIDLLILDEVPLMPPGYIDLICVLKKVKHMILLGDPLQTSYHSDSDALTLSGVEGDIFKRLRPCTDGTCACGMHIDDTKYVGPVPEWDFSEGDQLKGRRVLFFSRGGEGYKYNGGDHQCKGWPKILNSIIESCNYDPELFDHCLAQQYEAGGRIGAHADDEAVYPITNPILTIQVTGECTFTLSCRKGDMSLSLKGPKFFVMPNGCQQTHKHAVRALEPRLSLTFRSTRPIELKTGKAKGVPYLFFSNRMACTQGILGVSCYGAGEFFVKEVKQLKKDILTLCFSRTTVEEERNKLDICTVGQAQGLSRDHIQIYFDSGALKCSDETIVTAFTRARKGISLFYKVSKADLSHCSSMFLREYLKTGKISKESLEKKVATKLPGFQGIKGNIYVGTDSADVENHLSGDPGLKAMLLIMDREEAELEEMENESAPEPQKTHLAVSSFLNEIFPSELKAKEDREVHIHGVGFSKEIRDDIPSERFPGPYAPSSIYLHHTADDDVLFILSIRKRLRFADFEKNLRSFERKEALGRSIFSEFLKRAPFMNFMYPPQVDEVSMALDFTEKRIQKSAAILEAHSYRSDPDWPSNYLKIFIKNQDCTKMEKRGVEAKAGQTIACFSHAVLCHFGPILRKTEAQLRNILPPHILIFSQKNYDDLNDWSKEYFTDFCGTDSDYEAFDRSQDGAILSFEMCLLRHFMWPEDLIEEYKTLKLMMGCQLGDLAVMRFSGEFGTFFFNTMCNMAFTFLRYKLGPYQPIAFAGDDMVAPGKLVVDEGMNSVLNQLELKAKVNYSDSPLFCGWRMSPYGIAKDPNLLLDRLEMKRAEGKLDDCIANYALEASYGYRLCEHLFEMNIDHDAMQELIRKIVMLKHKLPKQIASLFNDEEDIISSEEE
ncbi:replication-associated protein [Grapevine virus L]|uniref:Replication-associated protein n=1 Tax=Grapevine virus L TaxID=2283237 RepID=A0A6N0A486_9VIRU|nr:replication-associated protein [Grapevine virus L]QKO00409.1 replication-associated protein [Grapevine virus L]QKO00414.1 replication-associated protein [Grapevine virus L]